MQGKPDFLWMLLEQHPLCHRTCKVTKETSEANKIMRNAIDLTSITFRWTSSSSQQSVFSTMLAGLKDRQVSYNGGQSFGQNSEIWAKIFWRWVSELLPG